MIWRKILTVEDSGLHRKMYDLALTAQCRDGAVILHAANGQEALDRLAEHPDTDLILLDINMPVMSGLEFLRQLKLEVPFKNIPVVLCSTEGKDEDIRIGLSMGARAYIKKPFRPEELNAVLLRLARTAR
jgi:two-component system, chemotaxis family, chemotaxis protein CheY